MLILSPEQYSTVPTHDLLCAAEQGFVGLDHRFLHAIVDDPDKSIPDLVRFGIESRTGAREELGEDLVGIFRHLRTPRALPFLIEYLRRHHEDADIGLICALREIGAAAVEPLLDLYRQLEREESSDAGFVLGSLGVRDPRILEALASRLEIDPVDAGHCLAAYGDPAAIPAIRSAIERLGVEDWMARSLEFCIQELEAGPRAREDEPFDLWELYPEETDPRFDLLTEEQTALFLDSSDHDNRFAAVSVLSEQATPKRLWPKLLDMARHDPDPMVRGECWQALADGWDHAEIRRGLRDCLADRTASLEERAGALRALAGREPGSTQVQSAMLEFYAQPDSRAAALQAMAISQDPKFARYFRERLGDPDHNVCAQAIFGIAALDMESDAPRLVPFFNAEDLRAEALPAYAMSASSEPSRAGLRRLFKKIDDLAGGLSLDEEAAVKEALNARAERDELGPVFGEEGEPLLDAPVAVPVKVGRNDPCPCGSGKKYKKCCGG